MSVLIGVSDMIQAYDLKGMLESWGHLVSAITPTKEEALQQFRAFQPDIVIMDPCLHTFSDGIEAAEAIRRISNIPIVYFTCLTDSQTLARFKNTVPFTILTKPCSEEAVKKIIETITRPTSSGIFLQ